MTRAVARIARSERISESDLLASMEKVEKGLWDASHGGEVYKVRFGTRGAYRLIAAHRPDEHTIVLTVLIKSERENVTDTEMTQLKALAAAYVSPATIAAALASGALTEIIAPPPPA